MTDLLEKNPAEPVILDESEEHSLVNMVSEKIRIRMNELYQKHPEYLNMNEFETRIATNPDEKTNMVRIIFWEEFHRAVAAGRKKMQMVNLWHTGVAPVSFYRDYISDDKKLAWILTPLVSHQLALKSYLYKGRDNIEKILTSNLFDADGNLKVKEARLFLDTYKLVEARALGAVVQRVEQKTQFIPSPDTNIRERIEAMRNRDLEMPVKEVEDTDNE